MSQIHFINKGISFITLVTSWLSSVFSKNFFISFLLAFFPRGKEIAKVYPIFILAKFLMNFFIFFLVKVSTKKGLQSYTFFEKLSRRIFRIFFMNVSPKAGAKIWINFLNKQGKTYKKNIIS